MTNERSDIEFPLWRKKVDGSLLDRNGTVIPMWLYSVWHIDAIFKNANKKSSNEASVKIHFKGKMFEANVTSTHPSKRKNKVFRLFFDDNLQSELRDTFLMSYMRWLEDGLRNKASNDSTDIEGEIPFWEFLDIEFDQRSKSFHFNAHYKQKPQFEHLFRRLTKSPALKAVSDELAEKEKDRIHKQGWKERAQYKFEIGAENVIYTLIDTKNILLYVGEAKKLIARFDRGHTEIKDWDYYKYNVLPAALEKHRITYRENGNQRLSCTI
jgi:uncharacterized protein YfcZ (UPF0381/DUF406 family)